MKSKKTKTSIQKDQLDRRFEKLRSAAVASPAKGWVRAIRESLGMSAAQLAQRLGMTRQSLHRIEKNELSGAVSIETLRRVAEALSCDLSLTLVPKESLRSILEDRAVQVAARIIDRTELHMGLEEQGTGAAYRKKRIKDLAAELIRTGDHRLWEDL